MPIGPEAGVPIQVVVTKYFYILVIGQKFFLCIKCGPVLILYLPDIILPQFFAVTQVDKTEIIAAVIT